MKNNEQKITNNKWNWLYFAGLYIILALPVITLPPWFYPPDWGKTIIFRSILAMLLFAFAYQFLYKRNELSLPNIKHNKTIWALAGLFLIYFISSIFSVDSYFSFWASPYRGGGFVTFAFYFVFAILTFIFFKKDNWNMAWIISISTGILVSLIAIFQYFGILNTIFISVSSRPGSTIGNPIFLGIYLLLLFFPTLSFAVKEYSSEHRQNKYLKIFYISSLLIFLYTILLTGSRAAYLGIIAGISCFLLLYPKKLKKLKICLGLFLVTVFSVVLYVNIQPELPKILQNRITQEIAGRLSIKALNKEERFRAWQTTIEVIKDKPVLGWGPENLSVGFDKNYDPNITWSPWWDKAHNVFLDIGTQTGI
ncbi:MAG: O-antigen ligase family protein, partial [Clostridia bacterium]